MKILLFIPARGGSKGIKNKNLVRIKNKPLIKFTIDIAKKLKGYDIFISSDSKKIINYCKSLGVKVEYIRPRKISKSTSSIFETILDAIRWLEKKGLFYENILVLQPTNPLRSLKEIKKIINIYKKKKLVSLASSTKMREHPYECIFLKKKKWNFLQKSKNLLIRRQDFDDNYFFIDGTYYLVSTKFLKKYRRFVSLKHTYFYKLDNKWPVDIDYEEDLKVASSFLS